MRRLNNCQGDITVRMRIRKRSYQEYGEHVRREPSIAKARHQAGALDHNRRSIEFEVIERRVARAASARALCERCTFSYRTSYTSSGGRRL